MFTLALVPFNMIYRPNTKLFTLICVVSLLFFGCSKKEEPFFDRYEVDSSLVGVEVYETEQFPYSILYEDVKRARLMAGTENGFSFYTEYYELGSPQADEIDILDVGDWLQNKKGTHIFKKKRYINGIKHQETRFFYKEHPFVLYGSFLEKEPKDLEKVFPGLFPKG